MNILYLSHLSGASYAGPTYSVPKQIKAQAQLDHVFWYNAVAKSPEQWKSIPYYHDLTEYPEESISKLPAPFNRPDIVVVECFYNMVGSPLQKELLKGKIPYVLVPRGELTKQAQKRKFLKKQAANILICKRYARKAAAIQYLTAQEYRDSGSVWNDNYIIIPNGVDLPEKMKETFSENAVKCVSIGRIEPYQKGLDMLIEACGGIKKTLEEAHCSITICGPDREGKLAELRKLVVEKELGQIIDFRDGVYGEEKTELLLQCDVFLIPSRFEGHPMALIEALSYGLPCVATTGSNMRDEIEEYGAGWTADNDVESIQCALKKMLEGQKKYKSISERAIRLSHKYDWNVLAETAHTCFENMIKK